MKLLAVALAAVLATLALAACGGTSTTDKAQAKVCDARSDISKQVDTLKGLTASTVTTDQISKSLAAIGSDLNQIKDAQGDLSDQRRSEVQAANDAFAQSLKSIGSSLVTSTSVADAKAQLDTALQALATSYKQTFAKIDCG